MIHKLPRTLYPMLAVWLVPGLVLAQERSFEWRWEMHPMWWGWGLGMMAMMFLFWALGVVMALWAAFPTLRYWEGLSNHTRWLGALPMLSVSLFLSAAVITATFT